MSSSYARLQFDRGTLVFIGKPPPPLRAGCGIRWDERTQTYRAPPWRHREIVVAAKRAGVRLSDEVGHYGALPRAAWNDMELRPYQRAALLDWQRAGHRGMCVLPTGAGKTRLAIAAIASLCTATLCLVPTRVLLHQWQRELARLFSGHVGTWGDGMHDPAALMVSTFESAYRHMPRWGDRYGLLVVDEAHHFGLSVRDELLEMSTAPRRLGLTATPREDTAALSRIAHLIGPTVCRLSVNDLSGRFLAAFDLQVHRIALEPDERTEYDRARSVFSQFHRQFRQIAPRASWKDFLKTANKSREGRAAVTAWRRSRELIALTRGKSATVGHLLRRHENRRVLVFTGDNAATYAIAKRFLVTPITCDIQRTERELALGRFQDGTIRAIVSSRVLNEGVDVPDADVAIIVGGSHGKREHVQRVGRLLRPREGKRAVVHELVADDTAETYQAERRRLGLI